MARSTTEGCGCQSDSRAWLKLCAAHEAEWRRVHLRAMRDYLAARPFTVQADEREYADILGEPLT